MVRVKRLVADNLRLLDPAASEWRSVTQETLSLGPTPLASQPSLYVQASWRDKPYGAVSRLSAAAAHNGENIYFRLQWQDEAKDDVINDTDVFADAAAVLFPVKGDAPLTAMGSPEQPVNAWYWRPDLEEPLSITAQGLGTTQRQAGAGIAAQAGYADGAWTLVISRALAAARAATQWRSNGTVTLSPGAAAKVAFAVWRGSGQERGGLKSVTLEWQPLEIER